MSSACTRSRASGAPFSCRILSCNWRCNPHVTLLEKAMLLSFRDIGEQIGICIYDSHSLSAMSSQSAPLGFCKKMWRYRCHKSLWHQDRSSYSLYSYTELSRQPVYWSLLMKAIIYVYEQDSINHWARKSKVGNLLRTSCPKAHHEQGKTFLDQTSHAMEKNFQQGIVQSL